MSKEQAHSEWITIILVAPPLDLVYQAIFFKGHQKEAGREAIWHIRHVLDRQKDDPTRHDNLQRNRQINNRKNQRENKPPSYLNRAWRYWGTNNLHSDWSTMVPVFSEFLVDLVASAWALPFRWWYPEIVEGRRDRSGQPGEFLATVKRWPVAWNGENRQAARHKEHPKRVRQPAIVYLRRPGRCLAEILCVCWRLANWTLGSFHPRSIANHQWQHLFRGWSLPSLPSPASADWPPLSWKKPLERKSDPFLARLLASKRRARPTHRDT